MGETHFNQNGCNKAVEFRTHNSVHVKLKREACGDVCCIDERQTKGARIIATGRPYGTAQPQPQPLSLSQPLRRSRDDRSRSRSPRRSLSPPRRHSRDDRSRSPPRRSPRNKKPWEDCTLLFCDHFNTLNDRALRKSCVVPYTTDAAEVTAGFVVAKGCTPALLSHVKRALSIGDKTSIRMLCSIGTDEPDTL